MFVGHFAVAFAAKRAAPEVPLGTLFLAAQLADLLWPALVLAGVERFEIRPGITAVTPLDFLHYPYSHSLVALVLWGAALGGACIAWQRRARSGLVLFVLVLSHWLLDVASHRPDMPLTLGGADRLGLGLWHSAAATVAVEGALFAAGLLIYLRVTRPVDGTGRWALLGLAAVLLIVWLGSVFGPPPPSIAAVAWSALGIWLFVAWGYWIERHRAAARN